MRKFKLNHFEQNIRACLSRKAIVVPPKKFTIERTYDDTTNSRHELASAAFSVIAPIAFILMLLAFSFQLAAAITHKHFISKDILETVTFIFVSVVLFICFFNRRSNMYWWNIGIWTFNFFVWGMATFNIWIYG
jgi:hypothetical protein